MVCAVRQLIPKAVGSGCCRGASPSGHSIGIRFRAWGTTLDQLEAKLSTGSQHQHGRSHGRLISDALPNYLLDSMTSVLGRLIVDERSNGIKDEERNKAVGTH
jgi:hypothetical protein